MTEQTGEGTRATAQVRELSPWPRKLRQSVSRIQDCPDDKPTSGSVQPELNRHPRRRQRSTERVSVRGILNSVWGAGRTAQIPWMALSKPAPVCPRSQGGLRIQTGEPGRLFAHGPSVAPPVGRCPEMVGMYFSGGLLRPESAVQRFVQRPELWVPTTHQAPSSAPVSC